MDDDLISREKALEVVKRHMCDSARIEQGILELQTAYSIDKVVKQINEEGGMERLTGRSANGTAIYSKPSRDTIKWQNNRRDVLRKLAEYEDLEEQGLLLKLPCKVGDPVWDIDFGRPCRYEVTGFSFGNLNEDYCEDEVTVFNQIVVYYTNSNGSMTGRFAMREIGKTVFLTREEAALHMQGEI